MIGKLTGILDRVSGNVVLLEVNGVGYVVQAGMRTLSQIGTPGDRISLLIETIVREESITLYGFADAAEQQWFKTLTTVQGVGPKVALSILSACGPDELSLAIGAKDVAMLTRAEGVGRKLAERLVTELKDKAGSVGVTLAIADAKTKKKAANDAPATANHAEDAVSALVNLGYGRAEAYQAVHRVLQSGEFKDVSALITASLKEMAA